MKPDIALIGPGKVGCAVTKRLHASGYPIKAVIGRNLDRAIDGCQFIGCSENTASTDLCSACEAQLIFLAVPDDQLEPLAKTLNQTLTPSSERILIHFSGLHSAEIMQTEAFSSPALSIHPLLPFADRSIASERLTDCPCALEGVEKFLPVGNELIKAFGGLPFLLSSDKKALYHASACFASNYLVTLLATATELLVSCGIEPDCALPLLLPLTQATLDNVVTLGTSYGLTGPIVRGDLGTVAAHLSALSSTTSQQLKLYQLLGHSTIELAIKNSRLPCEKAKELQQLLSCHENATN